MAAGPPLEELLLSASSVADDLGYVALADLARVIGDAADDCRVIGGHMVTVLAARWMLGADLYRETGDADIGMPPVVARSLDLPGRLRTAGYEQVAGNRFARTVAAIPVRQPAPAAPARQAVIDVLVPAYTGRARQNVTISENLVTTEVPGLAAALGRPPVTMSLRLRRLNGEVLEAVLPFADEVSALVLKALATGVRGKASDIADIWRCLEIGLAAGVQLQDFSHGDRREAAEIIRRLFARRDAPGMTALAGELGLSGQAADQRATRIRALVTRIVG
jgi:hypothetical protein